MTLQVFTLCYDLCLKHLCILLQSLTGQMGVTAFNLFKAHQEHSLKIDILFSVPVLSAYMFLLSP